MIKNIIKGGWMMLVLALASVSCSDTWDEHYATETHGDGTMWEAIASNPELSNFKAVLEACNYKNALDGNQMVTVFAPVNSCFTTEMANQLIEQYKNQKAQNIKDERNQTVKEFIRNHIALYNYSVASSTNDTIVMMNGKYMNLSASHFGKGKFIEQNKQTSNGILFTVSQVSEYAPNIYEYLRRDADLDSVANYIYQFSYDYFSAEQSVAGPIVDGKTTYLDSVSYLRNYFMTNASYGLFAKLDNEDSTYWFVAPTNEVWSELLPTFLNYYQYDDSVKIRDSLMYNNPRRAILRGTTFSMNENPEKSRQDSMLSTLGYTFEDRYYAWGDYALKYYQFDRPFDEGGIFDQTEDMICSNGIVKKTTKWNIDPTCTILKKITMEAESGYALDSVYKAVNSTNDPVSRSVATENPFYNLVSRHQYVQISPATTGNYKALYKVSNVLSNVPYDVYVVCVPPGAADTANISNPLKTEFEAYVFCNNEKGIQNYINAAGKMTKVTASNLKTPSSTYRVKCAPDPTKVDSVLLGTYTFPTCSYGLDKAQVKVLLYEKKISDDQHTRNLLLDCIVLKPHVD